MDNIIEKVGDSLIINIFPKINGRASFSNIAIFVDGLIDSNFNPTGNTLENTFRVKKNGIFWSDWFPVSAESFKNNYGFSGVYDNSISFQIKLTCTAFVAPLFPIKFLRAQISGKYIPNNFDAPFLKSSIFANILGTNDFKKIENNIFKKLYYRGYFPKYITRAENSDENEDKDFIDLFFSVSRFFSLLFCFSKRFEKQSDDYQIMTERVKQYGLYFNEKNISLEDLKYLASHLYDEIRKRGTKMVFSRKGDILPSKNVVPIDGELLRLLQIKKDGEVLFENIPLEKFGWCLGLSSPLYRGTSQSYFLNKTKENEKDFKNLNNFAWCATAGATCKIAEMASENKIVLKLNLAGNNCVAGLGRSDESTLIGDKIYIVDSCLDYEITFYFKVTNTPDNSSAKIKFGVEGFDRAQKKFIDAFLSTDNNDTTETFFEEDLAKFKVGVWYYARGIIHAYSSQTISGDKTNLGIGNNMYFNNYFTKFILPKIQIVAKGVNVHAEVLIWDYKIRPLIRGTNILPLKNGKEFSTSLGFVQSSRIFYTYLKNNNNGKTEEEITDIMVKYLLPYNTTDMFVFIGDNLKI